MPNKRALGVLWVKAVTFSAVPGYTFSVMSRRFPGWVDPALSNEDKSVLLDLCQ